MAFDPIVACLREITDYARFEQFCTDLMRFDGYVGIEPLGGVADKSRDSLLLRNGEHVIFHYSVRRDWRAKLWEDADGVRQHGHQCSKIVCVNPADFSTPERDECIQSFKGHFGWPLELYGRERIASMLRTNAVSLLTKYPQFFPPHLIAENRSAQLDVRVSPTRDKRQQLAQIVGYNRGPGPVLIEAWSATWNENDEQRAMGSMQCYRGMLPIRLQEKDKIDIIVALDFAWEGLETIGLRDAERRRHDASEENVRSFIEAARRHMPPPRAPSNSAPTIAQVRSQSVAVSVASERHPGQKHDQLVLVFRNDSEIPLTTAGATIEWKFDTDRLMAEKAHLPGIKVVESGGSVSLRRITQGDTSSQGAEVRFALGDDMAGILTELVTREGDIVEVKAAVHVVPAFEISETEHVREIATSVARSVLDSWD